MGRLATRASELALVQAEIARDALLRAQPGLALELVEVTTRGDRLQDVSLESVEGRGFFTDALERALLAGRADLAVHSLKDLPTELPEELVIASVLPRADARDVLVSPHGGLFDLPRGARVGTDSSRRRGQLALQRPDLEFVPVRGNVPTRLRKLDAGEFDALVLAAAGLARLGLDNRLGHPLDLELCLPAPGQGAIALQALAGASWAGVAAAASDPATAAAVAAERACLRGLGGGCQTPVGAHATVDGDAVDLAAVMIADGRGHRVAVRGSVEAPERCGAEAARRLAGLAA